VHASHEALTLASRVSEVGVLKRHGMQVMCQDKLESPDGVYLLALLLTSRLPSRQATRQRRKGMHHAQRNTDL
jgi:hypothetical protein